jgi:Protein of unknown function (DUF2690)
MKEEGSTRMKILSALTVASRRRTGAAIAAAATAAGLLTLAGPVASAGAATCHGGTCTWKDPEAAGCAADAQTLKTVYLVPQASGELRYSPSCDAAWIKTDSWSDGEPIRGTVYGQVKNGSGWLTVWAAGTPGDVAGEVQWSPMVGGFPHYDIAVS